MSRILSGAREALAIAKGEMDQSEYEIHVPENNTLRLRILDAREDDDALRSGLQNLDLVSTSMAHISERIDRAMDLTKTEDPKK